MTSTSGGRAAQKSPSPWAEFRDAYLALDRRVLGVFRIAFGGAVLYELLRRAADARLLYSNDGVLSNHFVLFAPQATPQLSLLTPFSSAAEVRFAFALGAAICALYVLGLFTRFAQLGLWLVVTSLNARNLMFEDGGICVAILIATWTLFLPLGDYYSIDALRRDAAEASIAEQVRRRRRLREPVVSLAGLAVTLQIAAIYWLNAVHKSGATWRGGDAVHYVLWQNRISTPIAAWLARHEPSWLSPLTSWLTLRIEYVIPILVLFPVFRLPLRTLAFALAVALHGGISLVMTLGIFSYAMMSLVLLRLPEPALLFCGRRLPRRLQLRLSFARSRLVNALRRAGFAARAGLPDWFGRRFKRVLAEGVLLLVLVACTLDLLNNNRAVPSGFKVRSPALLEQVVLYPRLLQRWSMFAPDAPKDDGILVIDAETAGGEHVDPFTGKAPDFDLVRRGPLPHSIAVADYLFVMHFEHNEPYRRDLISYLQNWHRRENRPARDRIVQFSAWWASYATPPRGSKEPGPIRKELVFRWR